MDNNFIEEKSPTTLPKWKLYTSLGFNVLMFLTMLSLIISWDTSEGARYLAKASKSKFNVVIAEQVFLLVA